MAEDLGGITATMPRFRCGLQVSRATVLWSEFILILISVLLCCHNLLNGSFQIFHPHTLNHNCPLFFYFVVFVSNKHKMSQI